MVIDKNGKTYTTDDITELAKRLTQKQWDKLFPPRIYPSEPFDASGYTGE